MQGLWTEWKLSLRNFFPFCVLLMNIDFLKITRHSSALLPNTLQTSWKLVFFVCTTFLLWKADILIDWLNDWQIDWLSDWLRYGHSLLMADLWSIFLTIFQRNQYTRSINYLWSSSVRTAELSCYKTRCDMRNAKLQQIVWMSALLLSLLQLFLQIQNVISSKFIF